MFLFKGPLNLRLFEAWGKPTIGRTEDRMHWQIERQEGKVVKTYTGKGMAWEWSTSKGSGMVRSSARVAELNALVSMLDFQYAGDPLFHS